MNLVERENNLFKLLPQVLEDLWILSQFITQDDIIFSKTERKVKIGNSDNAKQVKKLIFVELLVKKVSFEGETLRISGEIQNETEFTAIGVSHTLNFKVGNIIEIKKRQVLSYEEKLIKKSVE
jgi:stalled ribosome rescue protein Dom34